MKESILRLLKSNNRDDILIGFMLFNKEYPSRQEAIDFFDRNGTLWSHDLEPFKEHGHINSYYIEGLIVYKSMAYRCKSYILYAVGKQRWLVGLEFDNGSVKDL